MPPGDGVLATLCKISPIWHVTAVHGSPPMNAPSAQVPRDDDAEDGDDVRHGRGPALCVAVHLAAEGGEVGDGARPGLRDGQRGHREEEQGGGEREGGEHEEDGRVHLCGAASGMLAFSPALSNTC